VRELRDAPKADGVADLSGVAAAALTQIFDATVEKTAAALAGLLVRLAADGALTAAELRKGLEQYTEQLEDVRCAAGWLVCSRRARCGPARLGATTVGRPWQGARGNICCCLRVPPRRCCSCPAMSGACPSWPEPPSPHAHPPPLPLPPLTFPPLLTAPPSLDIPKAPELLGRVIGGTVAKGVLPLADLPQLLSKCEGAEPKRKLSAAAFKAVTAEGGDLAALCAAGGVKAGEFLTADELDGDLPSVEEWLKAEGISGVPV
jgi:hypothetical protein